MVRWYSPLLFSPSLGISLDVPDWNKQNEHKLRILNNENAEQEKNKSSSSLRLASPLTYTPDVKKRSYVCV